MPTPTPHDHETGLALFLERERRERFVASLAGTAGARRKELARLPHRPGLDPRWLRPAADPQPTEQLIAAVRAQLEQLGGRAGDGAVYVASEDPEIDGRCLPLAEALDRVIPSDFAALVSVVPGVVGLYCGELVDDIQLLVRKP